jgi:acetate CoA/acetoacetate CoA-transferase beta subunit
MIITEMGVMKITDKGVVLTELHPDYTLDDIKAATGCELIISPDLKPMEEE